MSPLRRWLQRLGASDDASEPQQQRPGDDEGVTRLADSLDRQRVMVLGRVESLTVRPRGQTQWLEAELGDGTGTVSLIWMGRNAVPGIEVGRRMRIEGRIGVVDGQRRIYNPLYTLL